MRGNRPHKTIQTCGMESVNQDKVLNKDDRVSCVERVSRHETHRQKPTTSRVYAYRLGTN